MRFIQLLSSVCLMISATLSASASVPPAQTSISTVGVPFTELAMKAKITHPEAQVLALKEQPGQVVAAALKSFEGILVWRVKILCPDRTLHELMINAADGKVQANTLLAAR